MKLQTGLKQLLSAGLQKGSLEGLSLLDSSNKWIRYVSSRELAMVIKEIHC